MISAATFMRVAMMLRALARYADAAMPLLLADAAAISAVMLRAPCFRCHTLMIADMRHAADAAADGDFSPASLRRCSLR